MSERTFSLRVNSNVKAFTAELRRSGLTSPAQRRDAARALNVSVARGREAVARAITKRYRLTQEFVLGAIEMEYATADRLVATLTVRGHPLSVARFDPRQTPAGVAVNITSGKTIKGAFVRTLKTKAGSEFQVVFMRKGRARYPVKALKTIDVPGVFSREEAQAVLDAVANESFDAEFVRELGLLLE